MEAITQAPHRHRVRVRRKRKSYAALATGTSAGLLWIAILAAVLMALLWLWLVSRSPERTPESLEMAQRNLLSGTLGSGNRLLHIVRFCQFPVHALRKRPAEKLDQSAGAE